MTSRVAPKHCILRERLREHELCPGPACAFWEEGTGCSVELLGLADLAGGELARHLLDLRLRLEEVRDTSARQEAMRRIAQLQNLNPE